MDHDREADKNDLSNIRAENPGENLWSWERERERKSVRWRRRFDNRQMEEILAGEEK